MGGATLIKISNDGDSAIREEDNNFKETKVELEGSEEKEEPDDEVLVHALFFRICNLLLALGLNFYCSRKSWQKAVSSVIVTVIVSINLYYVSYLIYLVASRPFNADTISTTLGLITWTLQATLSTVCLAYIQHSKQACVFLRRIYEAQKGEGMRAYSRELIKIVRVYYVVIAAICVYGFFMIFSCKFKQFNLRSIDPEILQMFGHSYLYIITQLASLYTILAWTVALFIFSLLIHATHYEFLYFNQRVSEVHTNTNCHLSPCEAICNALQMCSETTTDDQLCEKLLALIKIHNKLIDCVKRLDVMFNRYAFVMIATIIPSTLFALFIVVSRRNAPWLELLASTPVVIFCIFSFIALTSAPSKLHDTIYATKSALCANMYVWFPYRPNIYHTALAFACHLEQSNLGISIWGFAVLSKPLVLTTLSVMVTCLALLLQFSDCSVGRL